MKFIIIILGIILCILIFVLYYLLKLLSQKNADYDMMKTFAEGMQEEAIKYFDLYKNIKNRNND